MVLGHTKCGAIKGAVNNVKLGNLTHLLDKVQPAVAATTKTCAHMNLSEGDFTDAVASTNVRLVADQITENSPILKEMLLAGDIGIVCSMYNVESGVVEFYDDAVTMFEHVKGLEYA